MDDEAAIRELTTELLATLGYEVASAPDGAEAVKLYERALRRGENFHAVILDAIEREPFARQPRTPGMTRISPIVLLIVLGLLPLALVACGGGKY